MPTTDDNRAGRIKLFTRKHPKTQISFQSTTIYQTLNQEILLILFALKKLYESL